MSTLRTHIIHATNTRALPTVRYQLQHHNSLPKKNKKRAGIQPVAYASITKKVVFKDTKTKIDVDIPEVVASQERGISSASTNKPLTKSVWVKGHGAIERLDKKTGEVVHLVQQTIDSQKDISRKSQKSNVSIKTKKIDNNPTYQLVKTRKPLKIGQRQPSQIIPHETISAKPLLIKKSSLATLDGKENIAATLQQKLKKVKFYAYNVDGIFGINTKMALTVFQRKNNLKVGRLNRKILTNFPLISQIFPITASSTNEISTTNILKNYLH